MFGYRPSLKHVRRFLESVQIATEIIKLLEITSGQRKNKPSANEHTHIAYKL